MHSHFLFVKSPDLVDAPLFCYVPRLEHRFSLVAGTKKPGRGASVAWNWSWQEFNQPGVGKGRPELLNDIESRGLRRTTDKD